MQPIVYRIVNSANERTYIGSTVHANTRLRVHRRSLQDGKHHNRHLQRDWNKCGDAVFVFESLVTCRLDNRKMREQEFIDAYILNGMPLYNQKPSAGSREGFRSVTSEETKMKLRQAWKTRPAASVESRARMSASALGHIRSAETRAKMGAAKKGIPKTPEHRAKLSQITKQQWTPEFRAKIILDRTGKSWTVARRRAYEKRWGVHSPIS